MAGKPRSVSPADLLRTYDHGALQQLARKRGFNIKGESKPTLIKRLAPHLYDADTVAASLKDLEPNEREVLDRLILVGGEIATATLRRQLLEEGVIDQPVRTGMGFYQPHHGSIGVRNSRQLEDIIARLGVLGLVFTAAPRGQSKNVELTVPGETLFIPEGIWKHLPPVELPLAPVPPPPEESLTDPADLLRDLYVLLTFALDAPIPLTQRDQIPKRTLVQIDAALRHPEGAAAVKSEGELGRLPFLRQLAMQLGLLVAVPGGSRLGDDVAAFLAHPPGERQKLLYDAYRQTPAWSELARLRDISVWPKDGMSGPHMVAARKRVLAELGELPAERWITVDDLVDRMRKRAFDFLLPRPAPSRSSYYYYNPSYEVSPYHGNNAQGLTFERLSVEVEVGWDSVEGGVIRAIVTEALHWLGLVDLGITDGAATSFRITRAGATLLHGGVPLSPMPEPNVVVQPNFQIFALDPTGEDVLFTLDRIAKRVRAERVVEYQLTRESIYAAQRQGLEIEEIVAFLERVNTGPLPQNVRRTLDEWGAQHERIVVRRGVALIQTIDAASLDALYAEPSLVPLLGRRVAPTAATTTAEHVQALYRQLVQEGAARGRGIPALSEGNDAWPHPALAVDASGTITLTQRLPSIYILHTLREFAEEEPDGTFRLTPTGLRGAVRRGLEAEAIVATLRRLNVGPLPEETVEFVRRWAKDLGRGTLAQVALLGVEGAEVMTGLLADEELRRYINPIPGAPTFAVVMPDHAERVRELLDERGMELTVQLPKPAKRRR